MPQVDNLSPVSEGIRGLLKRIWYEGISQFPSVQIPEFDNFVITATDNSLPIRPKGDTIK
jgi:hypothetical protein